MSRRNNCMFYVPNELTTLGTFCMLFRGSGCNGYGKDCPGYHPHNAESRKALAEAIAKKKDEKENP